jgi:hypothetical protein
MKKVLYGAAAAALLSIGASGTLLLLDARALVKAQFGVAQREGQKTRDLLERQANQLRADVMARLDTISGKADAQLTATRREALAEIAAWRSDTAGQLAGIRADALEAVGMAAAPVSEVAETVAEIHQDLKPTLDHAASITAHADEASAILLRRDALPAQVLGLTAAAKVTLGETAQTMRSVKDATPKIAESAVAIADDARREADAIARPKHWYERILGPAYAAARVITLFW